MTVKRAYIKRAGLRTPAPVDEVNFNRCYTVGCQNFAAYPAYDSPRWSRQADGYALAGKGTRSGRLLTALKCLSCGLTFRLVSNTGAVEEEARCWPVVADTRGCRNTTCQNHGRPVALHPEHYHRFGVTDAGAQRYRCLPCGGTFSVSENPFHRLRQPRKTEEVLRLLVNKVPMRRLCEVAGITAPLLYQRIGLLHERLQSFARSQEERFLKNAHLDRMRVAVDRQDHPLAWGSSIDRQTFVLRSIVTADTDSGYVLAQHVNYDAHENAMQRELEARALGDLGMPAAYRRFARLWLPHDAEERRAAARERSDDRARTPDAENVSMAGRGAFVHEMYTLLGHFLFLRRWFGCATRVHVPWTRSRSSIAPAS